MGKLSYERRVYESVDVGAYLRLHLKKQNWGTKVLEPEQLILSQKRYVTD